MAKHWIQLVACSPCCAQVSVRFFYSLSLSLSLSLSSLRLLAGSVDVLVSVPTRKPVLYCVVEVVSFVCRFIIIIIIFFV